MMADENAIADAKINKIPDQILNRILELLGPLDQHEAGMVNRKWFDSIYQNPRNKVLSILFGNCYLDDLEPPLSYFIDSEIPYKRLVFGNCVRLGTISKFCATMGKTVEDLVIKQSLFQKKHEKQEFTAGRIADILEHMKQLKCLEINWNIQSKFLKGNTVFQKKNAEEVHKALQNVKEFRLIAGDVSAEQFLTFVNPMKNLESLFVQIYYSASFYNHANTNVTDWYTLLSTIKEHASTLRHLFIDLRFMDTLEEIRMNKNEILLKLANMHELQLESFSIHLTIDCNATALYHFVTKFAQSLKTLGPVTKNNRDIIQPAMKVSQYNLTNLVKCLPNLRNINVELNRGFIKDMTVFHQLSELRSLKLFINRFDRTHHIFHHQNTELPFTKQTIYPKLDQLIITGNPDSHTTHRYACTKCVLYLTLIYPNITRLELSLNPLEGITDKEMRLIFHHLTNLEVLGVTNCNEVTDDAFTGKMNCQNNITLQNYNENFAISNLKRLHTLLLCPLEQITDDTFIRGIAKLPNLKRIALTSLKNITANGIEALVGDGTDRNSSKLQVVYFEECKNFDDRFVNFLINRLIHLKYLRLCGSRHFTDKLKKRERLEMTAGGIDCHNVIWRAYNAYKIGKGQMPLNILDLES